MRFDPKKLNALSVRLYGKHIGVITRLAGNERAQLVIQSSSRPALQDYLAGLTASLFAGAARDVRWHLDVDPIEFD